MQEAPPAPVETSDVVDLRDRQGRLYGRAFRGTRCVEIRRGNFVAMFDLSPLDRIGGEVLFCNSALVDRVTGE